MYCSQRCRQANWRDRRRATARALAADMGLNECDALRVVKMLQMTIAVTYLRFRGWKWNVDTREWIMTTTEK